MPFSRAGLSGELALCCGTIMALALVSCATPSEKIAVHAGALGFEAGLLIGSGFHHAAYFAGVDDRSDTLRVYVEHDGTPWLGASRVSPDPTPRSPVALELMARDAGPRLWLGRPCYFEFRDAPGCAPLMWTHRRYAPEVVTSMVAALREFLTEHPFRNVVLVGYSGGGTLAWLMASHVPEATSVVTLAANLDTDYWTSLHGYSPMTGSLNPAREPPLPPAIRQVHYVGGRDLNVPPSVARMFRIRHPDALVVEFADFDHRCCWVERWPEMVGKGDGPAASQPKGPPG